MLPQLALYSDSLSCTCELNPPIYILYEKNFHISNSAFQRAIFEIFFFVVFPSIIFFSLSLLWPIHVWKTHYPIRFSRKTRKVYCHWYGKTYIEDWDTIKAYIQVKTDFNAQGAPGQTPQINIEFHNDDGSVAEHSVIGTDKGGLYLDEQAAAFSLRGPEQSCSDPDYR